MWWQCTTQARPKRALSTQRTGSVGRSVGFPPTTLNSPGNPSQTPPHIVQEEVLQHTQCTDIAQHTQARTGWRWTTKSRPRSRRTGACAHSTARAMVCASRPTAPRTTLRACACVPCRSTWGNTARTPPPSSTRAETRTNPASTRDTDARTRARAMIRVGVWVLFLAASSDSYKYRIWSQAV
jgi:hypothetical protein